jgi:hypothetical protein
LKKITSTQNARILYADMLRSLAKFRRARERVDRALERARRQATRDARVDVDSTEFDELIEQIADRDPTAVTAMYVSNRHRDDAQAYALAYLVEVDYTWRTVPFTQDGDPYAELRGEK